MKNYQKVGKNDAKIYTIEDLEDKISPYTSVSAITDLDTPFIL